MDLQDLQTPLDVRRVHLASGDAFAVQILAANPYISKTGFIQSNYFRSSEPTSSDSIAHGLSEEYPVSGHEFEQDVPPGSDDRSDLTESSHVFFVVGRTKRAKEPT